jgi:hypothetical protein
MEMKALEILNSLLLGLALYLPCWRERMRTRLRLLKAKALS